MTGTGIIILVLTLVLHWLGITNFSDNQIAAVAENVVQVAAFVWVIWGQVRRKDLKFGVVRRN